MTTCTTDAEAIARIIDPDVFCFHKSMIEAGLKDGLSADEARATADRCTAHSIPPAVVKAERILSYLASRREAQEPVAWRVTYADGGTVYLHHKPTGDSGVYECTPLYTAPPSPAPAGEVERLRKALAFYANPEIYKPHPHGPAFDRRDLSDVARAALNGGRSNG